MSELIKKGYFIDTGVSDRSTENFQHQIFENMDFTIRSEPISFYRSDFRSVRMNNMKFYKSDFDRADIVNAFISDSEFIESKWGTDFINTFFIRSRFSKNQMDTCTINNCCFDSCEFIEERVVNTANRGSTYKNCSFENCSFEMNSFNDITFIGSSFSNIDLSNMGAYDLTFENCKFRNVMVDPDYFGSYLFKNSSIEELTYAYRGNDFSLTGDVKQDLRSLAIFYQESGRFYEAFNTTLLFRYYDKSPGSVIPHFERIISNILSNSNILVKQDQLNRIIKTLIFYSGSEVLSASEIFYFIGYMGELNLDFFSLKDKLIFLSNIDMLAKTIESNLFDYPQVYSVAEFNQIYAEIQINEEDLEGFKASFDAFFRSTMSEYGHNDDAGYYITGIRKGSLIVEIIGYGVGFYVLATILKSTISKLLEIRMEYRLFKKADRVIEEKINDITELVKSAPAIRKAMAPPSEELLKKAIPLSQLMKQFYIFPNAVLKGRKIK